MINILITIKVFVLNAVRSKSTSSEKQKSALSFIVISAKRLAILESERIMDKVLFSSKKEDWETPPELFAKLDKEFHFTLDPCATKQNAKCKKYYTKKQNGLVQDWSGHRVFMNPPYGRHVDLWVQRAWLAVVTLEAEVVVCLLPARTDTRWFHDYVCTKMVADVRYLKGRVKFVGSKSSAPFPSMIVVFKRKPKNKVV